ncbi:MAG TPA: TIGR00730 family Rossman fold protein [Thermoanaerobaculia bacterium]|jgi:hypothetical protein|nr:TIGR00730 family Rossman fold protein [Thermoanaerobaculia bacterium]
MPFDFGRPMVAVFCGSRRGHDPLFASAARETGEEIARAGAGLVYGGGNIGLMGVVADAVLAAGAPVYGVIPESLAAKEVAHGGLTRLDVVESMHERKARISAAASGFLALPGGLGTLDEFFEIVTWKQLGHHDRPIVILNAGGFFEPLLSTVAKMTADGFVSDPARLFTVSPTPADAVRMALGVPIASRLA